MSIGRFLRTVRHLSPGQVAWRALHEGRLRVYRHVPAVWLRADSAAQIVSLNVPFAATAHDHALVAEWRAGHVEYLNVSGDRDDWFGSARPKLWRYERQYHRELAALAVAGTHGEAERFVRSWAEACPPANGDAWEPYPVARRLLNWSVAVVAMPSLAPTLAPFLAMQLRFMARHLEWHLRGNHLLCDASALVAASAVLDAAGAEEIGARGLQILGEQLAQQVLPDGGYAERTAHYHAVVMRDARLACTLAAARGRRVPGEISATLARMEEWLSFVRRADGGWPLLNDAVPPVEQLARTAQIDADVELRDTGWTFVRSGSNELLFDHGPIGPDEQPGHGHSDALSYELIWDGVPVVVDTGITTYAVGRDRDYERSSAAHATVTVDGDGPDELWGAFRVGARGAVTAAPMLRAGEARYLSGTVTRPLGWRHTRRIAYVPSRALIINDRVTGVASDGNIVSRIPLAPDAHYEAGVVRTGPLALKLDVLEGSIAGIERGWVGDGFGRRRPRSVLAICADATSAACAYALSVPGAENDILALRQTVA